MMKIKVELDLQDFLDDLDGEKLSEMLSYHVKEEVMRIVKKDAKYKAFINKQATKMLDNLDV